MAELVAEGAQSVPETDVRLRTVAEATADDLLWCDGIACGAPTWLGDVPWQMKRWWDEVGIRVWKKVDGKFACSFSSAGGFGGGMEVTCRALDAIMMNYGMLTFGLPDYSAEKVTLHYGAVSVGKPNREGERRSCELLGKRLAEWCAVYVEGRVTFHPRK